MRSLCVSTILSTLFISGCSSGEIYDYCTERVDNISEMLTHSYAVDELEKHYFLGQMDAFQEIISIIESKEISFFKK